jgi:hypothetical protein
VNGAFLGDSQASFSAGSSRERLFQVSQPLRE